MTTTTTTPATHRALWAIHDEADRYAAQDYTQLRQLWLAVRGHAQDGIDRLGTDVAMDATEYTELRGHLLKLRVAEDKARDDAGLFN